jgi:hypothetical protein
MVLVLKPGLMVINLKVNMHLARKMGKDIIFGKMEANIKAIGLIIK